MSEKTNCNLKCNLHRCKEQLYCQRFIDYQQGRADQKKEDNEFFNFDKVIEVEKNKSYQQGAKAFAEWLPQHFDLRFSNNPDVWIDEFFNHTRDKVLAEWQKGEE